MSKFITYFVTAVFNNCTDVVNSLVQKIKKNNPNIEITKTGENSYKMTKIEYAGFFENDLKEYSNKKVTINKKTHSTNKIIDGKNQLFINYVITL